MSASNREIQLQKTCQLYAYVLRELSKEVPLEVIECTNDYDALIDCVKELYSELNELDSDTFEKIVHNPNAPEANDLANWWEMYQIYIPIEK